MSESGLHPLLLTDPIGGGDLYVSELRNDDSGICIRGRFEVPAYARLDGDQARFLETFLRCRGMLSSVEKELGLSYPTVRGRLDSVLDALGYRTTKDKDEPAPRMTSEERRRIIEMLENDEIDADEAKRMLGVKP